MSLAPNIRLRIVTPTRGVLEEIVDEVQIPGTEGYFGVLPAHTPVLATLQIGQLWYRQGTRKFFLAVSAGFVEVLPESVLILADSAESAEEIDIDRAVAAKVRTEAKLKGSSSDTDRDHAYYKLAKALTRLDVAKRTRN
jgi:F-type H+-transporting ATPase subunit epsilon